MRCEARVFRVLKFPLYLMPGVTACTTQLSACGEPGYVSPRQAARGQQAFLSFARQCRAMALSLGARVKHFLKQRLRQFHIKRQFHSYLRFRLRSSEPIRRVNLSMFLSNTRSMPSESKACICGAKWK